MIKEISYGGWQRNLLVTGQELELVITLEVGPRVIRAALGDGPNAFVEIPAQIGGKGEPDWQIRGGHRLWTAPEADHSYEVDNGPVDYKILGESAVEIVQPAGQYGFQKRLRVEILPGDLVKVTHFLTNVSGKELDLAIWSLSTMDIGGVALIPQPALDLHPSEFPAGRPVLPADFLPNREVVLWPFTNLLDGRYAYSKHFLRLKYAAGLPATKVGLKLPTGWIAYENHGEVFAKHFPRESGVAYPDCGVNCELFTNNILFELESLAPALPLAPGATQEHVEYWVLRKAPGTLQDEAKAVEFFDQLPKV